MLFFTLSSCIFLRPCRCWGKNSSHPFRWLLAKYNYQVCLIRNEKPTFVGNFVMDFCWNNLSILASSPILLAERVQMLQEGSEVCFWAVSFLGLPLGLLWGGV